MRHLCGGVTPTHPGTNPGTHLISGDADIAFILFDTVQWLFTRGRAQHQEGRHPESEASCIEVTPTRIQVQTQGTTGPDQQGE